MAPPRDGSSVERPTVSAPPPLAHGDTSPGARPLGPRPVAATPWVSGVEYNGSASLATSVAVTMSLPDDLPPASDRYYVALSIFDGAESYDQVGFANDNGSWQVFYADATACGTRPDTHWDAFSLDRNTTYTFQISIEGGGLILFHVGEGAGATIWTENVHTGATYLQVESTQTCGASVVPGLTETEEVYVATLGNPPYNFVLTNASEDGLLESHWMNLPGSSNTTVIARNGSNVTLFNEPFTLGFAMHPDHVTIETAASSQELHTTVSVNMEAPGSVVGLSASTSAASWAFSASPASNDSSFVSVLSIDIPAGIAAGTYLVEIEASNAAGLSNRIALVITALPGLTLTVVPTPSSEEIDARETATLSPNATGGRPAYVYSWPTLPNDCAATPSGIATCHFATPGTYSLLAGVADTLDYALYRNVMMLAVADPMLSSTSEALAVGTGARLTINVTLAGGLPPFAIAWQGLPPGCTSVNSTVLSCSPTTAGQYSVTVSSTDHTGFRSSLTLSVSVQNSPNGAALSLGTVGLILIAAGMVILIGSCVVLLARRHA